IRALPASLSCLVFARPDTTVSTVETTKGGPLTMLSSYFFLAAAEDGADAGQAIALALGIGLGALGAGVGIGNIFGSMIQAVARQPELRSELTGIQWLGFALTEAVVFYGLIGGLLAFVFVWECRTFLHTGSFEASPGPLSG